MRKVLFALAILFSCSTRLLAQTPGNDAPASAQELKQLFDEKQWQPLLQKLSRVIAMKGQAAQSYDRNELFMMKGEAHLQLKQNSAATAAFEEASKVEGADKVKVAIADSSVLLVKRSQQYQYKRKSPTSQPTDEKQIDLLDQSKRKSAFVALAADEAAALAPKAKAASSGTSLRPIAEILKNLSDLKAAEIAATESTETPNTDAIVAPLAKHANDLSAKEVSAMKTKVDAIERSANQMQEAGGRNRGYGGKGTPNIPVETRYRRKGLMGTDMQALRDVIETCKNIITADKQLAEAFGASALAGPLEATAKEAEALAIRAKTILDTDYGVTTTDPRGFK